MVDTGISSQEDYRPKFEHFYNIRKLLITLLESIFQTSALFSMKG